MNSVEVGLKHNPGVFISLRLLVPMIGVLKNIVGVGVVVGVSCVLGFNNVVVGSSKEFDIPVGIAVADAVAGLRKVGMLVGIFDIVMHEVEILNNRFELRRSDCIVVLRDKVRYGRPRSQHYFFRAD